MQVHFSYHHGSRDPKLDKIIDAHVRKLSRLLVRFSPDLVHLHGAVEFSTEREGPICSLNLWLPTARLHSGERGRDLPAVVRASFDHLQEQVKKHKQVLRREGEWKRRRYGSRQQGKEIEAGELQVQDRQQLRDYLDQVMPQLKAFITREVRYQKMAASSTSWQLQEDEILNEVVAQALENHKAFLADSTPFHRLLAGAIHALNGPASNGLAAKSEKRRSAHTELLAPESRDPVDQCLSALPAQKRQVYVLHALEGFSYEEAAEVLAQAPNEVEETFLEVSRKVASILRENRPPNSSVETLGETP